MCWSFLLMIDPQDPLKLSDGEAELMEVLANSFLHSEKLQEHMQFLLTKGSMYYVCNHNLLFHGCIPMDADGELQSVNINGNKYKGKELLDKLDELVNKAYFSSEDTSKKEYACDFIWYLWCGPKSPLYGKDKMAFFERYLLEDESLHKEKYNDYYIFSERADVCENILRMFGIGVSNEDRYLNRDGLIEDDYRIQFVQEHLYWLHKAIDEGANCYGFHLWTPIDCFSWRNSYRNRYGLISVNIHTQKKCLKKSAYFFKNLAEKSILELSEEIYNKFN